MNCDNAGLVFAYTDRDNYWVKVYSNAQDKIRIYQISSGTWTLKGGDDFTITDDSPFTMTAEVRCTAIDDTYATNGIYPGQVGLWCGDSSDNTLDDFKVRDMAGPFEVDGRYFSSRGEVRTDNGDNNVLEAYATDGLEDCIIRRGFRGGTFVATYKFKWNDSSTPGFLVRWLNPGDYLALGISATDDRARLYRRRLDGTLTKLATADSGLGLTNAEWYEAKVVITESGGNQLLNYYVDTNQDSDFEDEGEHVLTDRVEVDDNWSAGYVGLYRAPGGSSAQEFDDLKVGYDNNSDGDIDDVGDDIQIEDDFSSNAMSLTYDNNGNLTDDGIFEYVYDGWNRLIKVTRRPDDETSVATYEYYGDNRRSEKVVKNSGVEEIANDGGNTTIRYYYGSGQSRDRQGAGRWSILETRNGCVFPEGMRSRDFVARRGESLVDRACRQWAV